MTDTSNAQATIQELEEKVNQLKKKGEGLSAWTKHPQSVAPDALMIPLSVTIEGRDIRVYLSFQGITEPESIAGLLQELSSKGYPLDFKYRSQWREGLSWKR